MSNIAETCRDMLMQRGYDIVEDDDEKIIGERGNDQIYVMLNIINKFNVFYFHICGIDPKRIADKHFNLWQGNIDLKWLKNILTEQAKKLAKQKQALYLVFEVPKQGRGLANDLKNINYFKLS